MHSYNFKFRFLFLSISLSLTFLLWKTLTWHLHGLDFYWTQWWTQWTKQSFQTFIKCSLKVKSVEWTGSHWIWMKMVAVAAVILVLLIQKWRMSLPMEKIANEIAIKMSMEVRLRSFTFFGFLSEKLFVYFEFSLQIKAIGTSLGIFLSGISERRKKNNQKWATNFYEARKSLWIFNKLTFDCS